MSWRRVHCRRYPRRRRRRRQGEGDIRDKTTSLAVWMVVPRFALSLSCGAPWGVGRRRTKSDRLPPTALCRQSADPAGPLPHNVMFRVCVPLSVSVSSRARVLCVHARGAPVASDASYLVCAICVFGRNDKRTMNVLVSEYQCPPPLCRRDGARGPWSRGMEIRRL